MVDVDGNETNFVVNTDKETVGDALLEQNLIEGDDSEYGLYVKTVNGITVDYDTDHTYWASAVPSALLPHPATVNAIASIMQRSIDLIFLPVNFILVFSLFSF